MMAATLWELLPWEDLPEKVGRETRRLFLTGFALFLGGFQCPESDAGHRCAFPLAVRILLQAYLTFTLSW
jgi:hypothetical protein